jgi:hypothetical protein
MTSDGWLSEPNGNGWYWIEGQVSAGPKHVQYFGYRWSYYGPGGHQINLVARRVYPVIDVPKEPT